jgi:beta-glucanase (GH16 family)
MQYGEIEARIELPVGSGMCSAFWMLGDSTGVPCDEQCGEIDIMENISRMPETAFATLHGPISGVSNFQQWEQSVTAATPLTGSWHTYGLIWRPNRITWTVDGLPYATATPSQLPPSARWVFNGHSFHILLDVAVGGWPGAPRPDARFPTAMRVDWVRVYD